MQHEYKFINIGESINSTFIGSKHNKKEGNTSTKSFCTIISKFTSSLEEFSCPNNIILIKISLVKSKLFEQHIQTCSTSQLMKNLDNSS